MKKDIHPKYYKDAKVTCVCGNSFIIGSTKKEIRIELCNLCHPFYTGKQKFVDTARRVEKFKAKMDKVKQVAATRKGKKAKKAVAKAKKADEQNTTTTKNKKTDKKKEIK